MPSRSTILRTVLGLGFLAAGALTAHAASFELERWLDEPDVKLVAVEFYADYCQPCKDAAPKWEALRKKYADQGLKLVVVNIGEKAQADGRCSKLPWRPDESLCDPELGRQLGVKELPEAFVWSWQGNLLVERGQHVADIEEVIRRYLDDNPRVKVEALNEKGKKHRGLQRQVEAILGRSGKLTVVADDEMRKRLAGIRKDSHKLSRREDQRCELGAEVSANSVLKVERFKGSVSLSLVNAVTGCQHGAASATWDKARPHKALEKAVYKLMTQLKRRRVQMPGGQTLSREAETEVSEATAPRENVDAMAGTGRLRLEGTPKGASLSIAGPDGWQGAGALPVSLEGLAPGQYQITASAPGYVAGMAQAAVRVDETTVTRIVLQPPAGVMVTGSPSEAAVSLIPSQGSQVRQGRFPFQASGLPAGDYRVRVTHEGYTPYEALHRLKGGETTTVEVRLEKQRAKPVAKPEPRVPARREAEPERKRADSPRVDAEAETADNPDDAEEAKPDGKAALDTLAEGFVRIVPGSFWMGSPPWEPGRDVDEVAHWVEITRAFALQATEVTQGQWQALMGTTPSKFSSCGARCPVERVSWWDAVSYTNALSAKAGLPACYALTGCNGRPGDGSYQCSTVRVTASGGDPTKCQGYRLPTEAEWEYAARAWSLGPVYTGLLTLRGKNNGFELDAIAWYAGNSGVSYRGSYDCSDWPERQRYAARCGSHPVARKLPNIWGLYDMLGNVWEWTWDWYAAYSGSAVDPTGTQGGSHRVIRGGAWYHQARSCRAAHRSDRSPTHRGAGLGFRVARTLP